MRPRILIYGMDDWSHARVYWDLINSLAGVYTFDYISWYRHSHDLDWPALAQAYQAILVDMNTVLEFFDSLFVDDAVRAKILPINHGPQQVADYTFASKNTRLRQYLDKDLLQRDLSVFKLIACVSPNTVHSVKKEAPALTPKLRLTTLGANPDNFPWATFPRTEIRAVGYFTHIDPTPQQGFDTKRGKLAQAVCAKLNLPLIVPQGVDFRLMDLWYQKIDVYLMTSIYEGAATPLLEAGVCGIPIIASPAGLAPQFLMNGGGVLTETFDEAEYIKLACNTLTFWQDNPAALRAESEKIYENTRDYFSWDAEIGRAHV